ncbi:Signal transduction histidine kinase CheA [hydrothermal vent metagenome]|uniref:Chemotaxis protein CheA n=1 Tax=hydrothermal vent metagenome TaxID=652676 RepID=A0A3B0Z9A9_9ZZZZ
MTIDITQFHETFFEESFEGLDIMESGLLNLDIGAADNDTVNSIFRAAHSIKGGSATFGFTEVAEFTHGMETLLDEMRDGSRDVTQSSVDTLLQSVDCLREMLAASRDKTAIDTERAAELKGELEAILGTGNNSAPPDTTKNDEINAVSNESGEREGWQIKFRPHHDMLRTGNDPVRMFRELGELGELSVVVDISQLPILDDLDPEESYLSWELMLKSTVEIEKVKEIFEWVEDECDLEIIEIKEDTPNIAENPKEDIIVTTPTATPPKEASKKPAAGTKVAAHTDNASIRVSIDKVDALINMVGELVITQSMIGQLDCDFDDFDISRMEKLRDGLTLLERNTRELQESVMRIRMLPISFAFNRFPRMVHDLCQKLDKKIEIKMTGEQTELDKTVMEKIGDPLVHLVRNSIDHGIEMPEVRLAAGKPESGTIELNAFHKGGNIIIEIKDDGAGFNKDRIKAKAIEKELISSDENLTDDKIYDLLFQPGFSTAEQLSDISGRGVGMDVVRRNIRELGGNIDVKSEEGHGTTFTIRLPLTLAILDGQLVCVGDQIYITPLVSIVESLQIKKEFVNNIAGQTELYKVRNEYIPIVRMHDMFGVNVKRKILEGGLLVIVEGDGKKVGLLVDELLGQQQVVIKSLETNYKRVGGVSGATILGDGTVALILDVDGLIDLSRNPLTSNHTPESSVREVA